MYRFFNRVQAVHRLVQRGWCSFLVTWFWDVSRCTIRLDLLILSGCGLRTDLGCVCENLGKAALDGAFADFRWLTEFSF